MALEQIQANGFTGPCAFDIVINDEWIARSGYTTYVLPEKDSITVQVGKEDSEELFVCMYDWAGAYLGGDGMLEAFVVDHGLIKQYGSFSE